MFENIDLTLVFLALGVIFSGCLVIVNVYQAYNRYVLPKKERRMRSEKIQSRKTLFTCQECAGTLERSLKGWVETAMFQKGFNVSGDWSLLSDFEERIDEYNETYDRCVDWVKACEDVMTLHLQKLTREHLPNTCKEYDLVSALNTDELKQRYLNGEEVTKHWIEKTYPTGLYEVLMENLKDKETKLDFFFKRLNETFQNESVLNRFRKEKKELMKLGYALLTDLKTEEENLQKELQKYKDIENVREPKPEGD